jgi:hypothetical protein
LGFGSEIVAERPGDFLAASWLFGGATTALYLKAAN